ncbi:protein toll-like [Lytechinus pictus]|uniref:protein toll-like n=1 Tax=Lytechinus pictus TaxID=7653 RepID=UPI0030B9D74C
MMRVYVEIKFLSMLFNMLLCLCEALVNSTVFTPYVIDCPIVPLPEGNSFCQCDPPNITVTSADLLPEFDYVSCKLTQDLISETNPNAFCFPRSRKVYVDCSWNNSLSYHDLLKSVEKESGDIAEEVQAVGDINCFAPFALTADTYEHLPGLQKLNFFFEDVTIRPYAFSPITNLEVLSLIHLDLKSLHPEVFRGLTHLRQLSLWDNNLRELPDGIFNDLQDLQDLSLMSNNIVHISRNLLRPLEFLNRLFLNNNNISSIHPDAFRPLRSLEEVDLSFNNLDGELRLSFLSTRKLSLSHNSLTKFSEDTIVGGRGHTVSLDLSYNFITSITEKVFHTDYLLSPLLSVNLNNNRLESLPKNILRWGRRLTVVDLSYNSLETLPNGLFDIRSNPLGKLRLAGNQLVVKLSGNPFSCDCRLSWFRLYDGQDVWISDHDDIECFSPPKLQGLSLFSVNPNQFECPLPDSACPKPCKCYETVSIQGIDRTPHKMIFVECKYANFSHIPLGIPINTSSLEFTGNKLKTLRETMLNTRLSMLKNLTFSMCNIEKIESGAFRTLNSVLSLKLDGNNFNVTKGIFQGLTQLNTLYLNNSSIRTIAEGVFLDTPSLTQVYLHGNLLTVLPASHSLPKSLEIMSLQHNPLVCSCNLIPYQGLTRYTPGVVGNATCKQKGNAFVILGQVNPSYCTKGGINPIHTVLISLGAITGVISVVFICFVIYKKNETLIKLMLLEYFPEDLSEEDANKPFDVFISYSQLDDEFVLRYLVPLLENEEEASYSICLHHRHFIPGDTIANNIVSAVAQSRRVILVLSKNFLESDWCMYEFRMAHLQALQDRRNTLLIITLGDICEDSLDPDLKAHVKTTTYLESSDSKFKYKLFLALKRGRLRRRTSHDMKLVDLHAK